MNVLAQLRARKRARIAQRAEIGRDDARCCAGGAVWSKRLRQGQVCAVLLALALVLLPPAFALADAPVTRGPASQGQGGMGPSPDGGVSNTAPWRDVRELPPPSASAPKPAYSPAYAPMQQDGESSGPITWLGRNLNPGNWILDAGMGIFAGIVKMFGGMMQKAVQAFLGTASVLPSGCDDAATNFVFCTPASLTYDHPGVQATWAIVRGIAAGLVSILFAVRLGRLIAEGPRSLAAEGKGLLLTFICSMSFIQATGPICRLLVEFFNGVSNLLLARAALALPSQDVGDLNIGSNILFLLLWSVILLLVLKSFARIVQIIILLAMAPIAGALLMDRSTSGRFRSWFEKLLELLLSQINLAIIFIVIAAILQPYQGRGAGDAFVGFLLSIVMMGMALNGRSAIGIAGAAISGSGGGIMPFLRYQLAGNGLRGVLNGRGRAVAGERSSSGGRLPATSATLARATRTGGDPAQSAAAQRQSGPTSAANVADQPGGSFRPNQAGDGLSSRRASARYQAAAARRGADGEPPLEARREQALMRATMMRRRANELRAQGDAIGAELLDRKARTQAGFGRGADIARPSRFTDAERARRRQVHREALAEVTGMHALERDALTHQLRKDEERLPIVQRDLAMAGSTGADTGGLHDQQQEVSRRMAATRARLLAISPGESGGPTPATRLAAAALANERLPQQLRGRDYALRHGVTSNASPLVRRLAGATTQAARDELAHARAATVRAAQTNPRPPIAPPRRRASGAGRRNQPAGDRASNDHAPPSPGGAQPARPSRARSQTIALLRARKHAQSRAAHDPITTDMLRSGARPRDDAER